MYRNHCGDPFPRTSDEMEEAIRELDFKVSDTPIIIETSNQGGPFAGYVAEAIDNFGTSFSTGGYPTIESLTSDLKSVGFELISVLK